MTPIHFLSTWATRAPRLGRGAVALPAALACLMGVTVAAQQLNVPPTVSLVRPGPDEAFTAPARVEMVAHVADPDSGVVTVEFYGDERPLGVVTADLRTLGPINPFRWVWEEVGAGEHVLRAQATDADGAAASSEPLTIVVKEPAPLASIVIRKPASGARFTAPATIAIEAVAVDPNGEIRHVEFYAGDRLIGRSDIWTRDATIPGRLREHFYEWTNVAAGTYRLFAQGADAAGKIIKSAVVEIVVERVIEGTVLVKAGSVWRFLGNGTNLGREWIGPGFDDSKWPTGPAQLGYGDGDEATVIQPPTPRPITTYFRQGFEVADASAFGKLIVRLVRDDGAVVYLNGKELLRANMPGTEIGFNTPAASTMGDNENQFFIYEADSTLLVNGQNLLAVEIHQASATSSDISFDLELIGGSGAPPITLPVVSLVASVAETAEPSPDTRVRPGVFLLSRTGEAAAPLTVFLEYGGTATPEVDYSPLPRLAEFPAGQNAIELLVGAIEDGLVEGNETVIATLVHGPNAAVPAYQIDRERAQAMIIIADSTVHGEPPLVGVEAVDDHASELPATVDAIDWGRFRISRTGPATEELVVAFTLGGTATPGKDYREPDAAARIPVGQQSVDVDVVPVDDELSEGRESVILTLREPESSGPGYYRVDPARQAAEVVIADDEALLRILRPGPHYWFAAGAPVRIQVSAVDPHGYIDHVEFFAGDVRIGESVIAFLVAPPPGTEVLHEFVWNDPPAGSHPLSARAQTTAGKTVASATTPIVAGEAGQRNVVTLQATDAEASEVVGPDGAADVAVFTLRRTGSLESALSVSLLTLGTATPGHDYARVNEENVVQFAAGQDEVRAVVRPTPDLLVEGDETVELAIASPECEDVTVASCYLVGTHEPARAVIHDAGPGLPSVSIRATQPETLEPGPNVDPVPGRLIIGRSGATERSLVVEVAYEGTATAGKDYVELPTKVTILAGQAEAELTVAALDDLLVEGDETVIARVIPIPRGDDPAGTDLPDYVVDPEHAAARVVIQDNDRTSERATLQITAPHDGETFPLGRSITITLTALDPSGYINRVEFYDGDQLLGVSELHFFAAPEPGTPIFHTFEWANAAAGPHLLTARAKDVNGLEVISNQVRITVGAETNQVVLVITAADPLATETGADRPRDPAVLVIKRVGGAKDVEVPVFYSVSGTAQNGVDYAELNGQLLLPHGAEAVELIVSPLPDSAREGEETVVVKLEPPACIQIVPPPPQCYLIGEQGSARAVILDGSEPSVGPPTVTLLAPRSGAVFALGDVIEIRARASTPEGQITRLDILADERLLQSTELGEVSVAWSDAGLGPHVIVARALDSRGLAAHSAAKVLVRDLHDAAFVQRALPEAYAPGVKFNVELRAEPPSGSHAYAVEDRPPGDWTVSEVSHEGAFDAVTGKVKFGPFTDGEARTLSYGVTPPPTAAGRVEFAGSSSIDGKVYPIAGDQLVESVSEPHPADRSPTDQRIVMTELTAYAAAWKQGETWPEGPNPIPIDYVTRAGKLWTSGERYLFDPTKGPAPLCWVSATEHPQALHVAGPDGEAARITPIEAAPGQPVTVRIPITPPAGAAAYAVEEKAPEGWQVAELSDEGHYDAKSRCLRWGLFLDGQPRVLTYQVTPPANVTVLGVFHGRASFDGIEHALGGAEKVAASDLASAVRFTHIQRGQDGRVQVKLTGRSTQPFVVEVSTDLVHWAELDPLFLSGEETDYEDAGSTPADGQRYYRARVR